MTRHRKQGMTDGRTPLVKVNPVEPWPEPPAVDKPYSGKRRKKDESNRVDIRKALAMASIMTGREISESAAITSLNKRRDAYGNAGAVEPPYDPESLLNYIELTPHVLPNIASYQTNIEGYGYQAVPVVPWLDDLDSKEARDAIRSALQIEQWIDEEEAALDATTKKQDEEPTLPPEGEDPNPETEPGSAPEESGIDGEIGEEDVDTAIAELRIQLRRDKYLFDSFFANCCSTMSFTKLRSVTRYDIEAHGWGAWEMLVDGFGRLKRLNYIPGYTVRPLKDEGELVKTTEPDPVTPLSSGREVVVHRRFRVFVQIVGDQKVYFKSPGDPRVVSRTTGKVYESLDKMRAEKDKGGDGKNAQPANELIYFALHDPRTPCPPPRWIGNLLAVLGVREADETNYHYLDSSAIPPGMLFISGGRINRDMKDRLEQRLTQEFAGSDNRHKILVVEAQPTKLKGEEKTMLPSIHFESLRDAQQTDATFVNYDTRSADRIGASFRLPPMLRGYTPDNLNRATAIAALDFAETQVYEPEREDEDWTINKYIVPRIGVKLHSFRSNTPPTRSPEEISQLIQVAAPHGGLLPQEIRSLLSDALNKSLVKVTEEWANWPMPMTLAGLGGGTGISVSPEEEGTNMGELANRIDQMQRRVEAILTDELRNAGFDMQVALRPAPEGIDKDQ